jgi:outer membrane lipoprotein-sorting protein
MLTIKNLRQSALQSIGVLLLCGVAVHAQHAGFKPVANLAAFKETFAVASQKTNSIKSDFVQEKNLSMLSEKMISKGKFWFKKDNLIRMEYVQPFHYLMVMNKNDILIRNGQKESKISTQSNKMLQQINKITLDCVQGTALSNPDFGVKVFENSQYFLIEMTPLAKNLKNFFKRINITVERKEYAVSKIEMVENSGDNTLITFLNKELNTSLPDALFAVK